MTEEPRRSGRATKGQHTKNVDEPEPAQQPKPTKGKKKSSKKTASEADDEDENELIRCVCGHQEDDEGRMMICCEKCSAWQHNDCMGLPEDEASLPEKYWCEQCKPGDHKELLAAMKRGEKLWEERAQRAEDLRRLKKKGRGKPARQSQGHDTKPEAGRDGGAESKASVDGVDGSGARTQVASQRRSVGAADGADEMNSRKRKPSAAAPTSRKASKPTNDPLALSNSVAEIPDEKRRKVAEVFHKTFAEQIRNLSKKGKYRIPDGHTADSLSERYSLVLEYSMFINLCGDPPELGGPYSQQMRTILHNIPKNPTLLLRLLDDTITADSLSKMSSDEMASEELQQQMAAMKEEAEKQSIIIQEAGPRIRRTHKGEELVDDQTTQPNSDSVISAPPPRRRESNLDEPPFSPTGVVDKEIKGERTSATPLHVETSRQSPIAGRDRKSSQFNIQSVWTSVHSPDSEQAPKRQSSGFSPDQTGLGRPNQDADIDRLLNDDEDSATYSPAEYSAESTTVWHGEVDMPLPAGNSFAKFTALAHHVAGSDLSTRTSLASIFPTRFVMDGRIDTERADKYLTSLSAARSTDVTVFNLTPAGNENSTVHEFRKLYNYLVERGRFGVIGERCHQDHVRDIYIVPLDAGMSEMPTFLQRLYHNIIEQPRPQKMLLVVFVLKWEPTTDAGQVTPGQTAIPVPAMSPHGAHQGSGMSPIAGQTPPNLPSGPYQFPSNPYAGNPSDQPPQAQELPPNHQLALQILGSHFYSPTAQRLLQTQEVPAESLENLRKLFEKHPEAKNDFDLFTHYLQQMTPS